MFVLMKNYACKIRKLSSKYKLYFPFLFFSFVASLGTVFEWATKDLSNKLVIFKEHQRLDPVNYQSIQSMICL